MKKRDKELQEQKLSKEKVELFDLMGNSYTNNEKELIYEINDLVMSADGTAEQWGGYNFIPSEYLDISLDIFQLTKRYFSDVN